MKNPRRFIIDSDGSNVYSQLSTDVHQDMREAVQELPAEVTTVMVCANAAACFWPTKIGTPADAGFPPLGKAHAAGIDPMRLWLENLKAAGKEVFVSYRMNDVHQPTEAWNTPAFRKANPDCVVGLEEIRQGRPTWMSYCMDYTLPVVREHVLSLIQEMLSLYGDVIDGLQLDWMRFPRHLSGDEKAVWAKRDVLTSFTAQVHQLLDETERPIQLGARVPTTTERSRTLGMDVKQWAADGHLDLLVVCPFLTTDWQIPIASWREEIGPTRVPVYAGFDLGYGEQVHYPESLRGICTSLYEDQPDGLYLFNFPCWIERLGARPYHWLAGLDDPRTACARPMALSVNHQRSRMACDAPAVLPMTINPGESRSLAMRIPAASLPCWRARVHLENSDGPVSLSLAGQAAAQAMPGYKQKTTRSETFMEFVNEYRPKTLRALPEHCQEFRLEVSQLKAGMNEFILTNTGTAATTIKRFNLNLW